MYTDDTGTYDTDGEIVVQRFIKVINGRKLTGWVRVFDPLKVSVILRKIRDQENGNQNIRN